MDRAGADPNPPLQRDVNLVQGAGPEAWAEAIFLARGMIRSVAYF